MDDSDSLPARALLTARVRELVERAGETQSSLHRLTGFSRTYIGNIVHGKTVLSQSAARVLDDLFGTGVELQELRAAAEREKLARRYAVVEPAADSSRQRVETAVEADGTRETKAGEDTNRRDLLALLATSAGDLVERIRSGTTSPDRQLLFHYQCAVHDYAIRYGTTSHGDLLVEVGDDWRRIQTLLADGWKSDQYKREFTVVAGQLTYILSRLAFNLGDFKRATSFLTLVETHASQTGDPALGAAVATMWSSLFYYMSNYDEALRTAQEGHTYGYGYHEAELYAYEARAYSRLGRRTDAVTALNLMEKTLGGPAEAEAGGNPFTEESALMISGGVWARLGDSERALPITTAAIERYGAMPEAPFEEHGNAWIAHATALVPSDPDAAASAACTALEVLGGRPTRTVFQRAADIARDLAPHSGLASLGELRDRVRAERRLSLPGAAL
ncbi:helix-turn-helix domain-containing protein [Parafrankia sp. FMc2]|uniref:helix-turn-helix domain-containing protein n=1 Tax=Parafrankia sp. FMc2 TaxID=3233196 RepID=UPI0034D5D202